MKIPTELRHIINSKFPTHADTHISDEKAANLVAAAAKKKPQIKKALAEIVKAQTAIKAAGKVLVRFGMSVYADGDWNLNFPEKLKNLVSLPPKQPTRNEILHKLSSLTPAEGVTFLKTLGIDWS